MMVDQFDVILRRSALKSSGERYWEVVREGNMVKKLNWPEGYQTKVEEILGGRFEGGEMPLNLGSYDTVYEAKFMLKKIRLIQKQLRQIKKEASREIKEIRDIYTAEGEKIADSGTFTSLFLGKRAAGRDRQRKRAEISQRQKSALQPYESVKETIDTAIVALDGAKLDIEAFIMQYDT